MSIQLQLKFAQIFILVYLKIFFQASFLKKLSVISSVLNCATNVLSTGDFFPSFKQIQIFLFKTIVKFRRSLHLHKFKVLCCQCYQIWTNKRCEVTLVTALIMEILVKLWKYVKKIKGKLRKKFKKIYENLISVSLKHSRTFTKVSIILAYCDKLISLDYVVWNRLTNYSFETTILF